MARLEEELKQVPLLASLGQRHLRRLAAKFRERDFPAGTSVLREGHMSGIGFFVITEGEASVAVAGLEVRRLGAGDFFGEIAVLRKSERSATARALEHTRLLVLDAADLHHLMDRSPRLAERIREVAERRVGPEALSEKSDIAAEEIGTDAGRPERRSRQT